MDDKTAADLATLDYALGELRQAVIGLNDAELAAASNCSPWTVRQLASHALNNQLFWSGLVTGQSLVDFAQTMGAAPIAGDLAPVATDTTAKASSLWRTEGVFAAIHATPLGDLPGSVVVNFAIIDAIAHAWDITATAGRAIDFRADTLDALAGVFAATCTDGARDHGLIKAPAGVPADATETEKLMASAGRDIPR